MKIIGLTGDAGSGKSTVAALLQELGARVISADDLARVQAVPGSPVFEEIVDAFGTEFLTAEGTLDRRKLAGLVFRDETARSRLNGITHPPVIDAIRREIKAARGQGKGVLVVEVPLLYETESAGLFDQVWVVTADTQVKTERLMQRGVSRDLAEKMLNSQLPEPEKAARADRVINNSGTLAATKKQVHRVWTGLDSGRN